METIATTTGTTINISTVNISITPQVDFTRVCSHDNLSKSIDNLADKHERSLALSAKHSDSVVYTGKYGYVVAMYKGYDAHILKELTLLERIFGTNTLDNSDVYLKVHVSSLETAMLIVDNGSVTRVKMYI